MFRRGRNGLHGKGLALQCKGLSRQGFVPDKGKPEVVETHSQFLVGRPTAPKEHNTLVTGREELLRRGLAMAINFWLAGSPYENGTSALAARLIAVLRRRKANETTEDLREMTLIHETGSHTRLEDRHV